MQPIHFKFIYYLKILARNQKFRNENTVLALEVFLTFPKTKKNKILLLGLRNPRIFSHNTFGA